MDTKVILMVFGVILLLAAIFFFFKSFASHESRMQEEQRLRVELERKKLAAERAEANRPLTPEELEQKRRLREAREKAEAARRAASDAIRAEAERKRLEQNIETEKRRAAQEKQSAEEARLAEELRLKQAEEAKKRAEEERLKAEAAAKVRREAELKQQGEAATIELRNWMESVLQQSAAAYPVKAQPPMMQGSGATRMYVFPRAVTGIVAAPATYNSPDEMPGFISWPEDKLVAFCKKAMMDDASHQDPQVEMPAVFAKIGFIEDVEALKDLNKSLAGEVFKAQDAEANARKNQSAGRNLVSMALRQIDKLDRQEAEVLRQTGATTSTGSRTVGTTAPSNNQMVQTIRVEKEKQAEKMRTQVVSYWKAMNQARGSTAAVKQLNEAKRLVATRLGALGVEDVGGTAATSNVPKEGDNYKIYVLQDGTEIKAYTVVKMGDKLAIKDESGEVKMVDAGDVKEIKKP